MVFGLPLEIRADQSGLLKARQVSRKALTGQSVAVDLAETGPIAVGDTVVARETTYRVADLRPDGQGMVVLDLEIVP